MATRSAITNSVGVEYGRPALPLHGSPPKVRNILILGKAGVGKSTIANQIIGSQIFKISTPVGSVTRQIGSNIVTGQAGTNGTMYNIKLIDTAGQSNHFSIEHIDDMKLFLEAGIHLVIFVSKNARFTNEDSEAFKYILEMFGESIANNSALVVTCCEGLHEIAREALVKELYENENTKDITCAMKKGVLTVGFPIIDAVKPQLQPIYQESAKKDEQKLRLLVDDCSELMIMPLNALTLQQSGWLRPMPRRVCGVVFITVTTITILLIHFDCLSSGNNFIDRYIWRFFYSFWYTYVDLMSVIRYAI